MPYEAELNPQTCTFAVASDLAARLRDIGVPVGTIYEITPAGDKLDTTNDRYVNDGELYQYVAAIWTETEQSLAVTNGMFLTKGYNFESFTKLAQAAGLGDGSDEAIMKLHGCVRAVNANLTKQMT
jgi:hypothetical protein